MNTDHHYLDPAVVSRFGDEWPRFDQSELSSQELNTIFNRYFATFPWGTLPANASGIDLGRSNGRKAKLIAPRAGQLHCIDPSAQALAVARRTINSDDFGFHLASADTAPLSTQSCDFSHSPGVLYHLPDPAVSQLPAGLFYFLCSRLSRFAGILRANVDHWPRARYQRRSRYVMRNDSLDRFGARLVNVSRASISLK